MGYGLGKQGGIDGGYDLVRGGGIIAPTPVAANFTADTTTPIVGATVTFTDTSTGSPTIWAWQFGDLATSTLQNPTHAYASPGPFTVTLQATNAGGATDIEAKAAYINVTPLPPVANFSADDTSVFEGDTVTFTDLSTNTPTSWAWTFGDAGTSALQNPTHVYTTAGTYTVTLTATNAGGSDLETKTDYITVQNSLMNGLVSLWKLDGGTP